jgi:hypothetical protein
MKIAASLVAVLLLQPIFAAENDQIKGVWEFVSSKDLATGKPRLEGYTALSIYTATHYSVVGGSTDRKRSDKPREKLTKDELLDYLDAFGFAGSYRISGNQLIRRRVADVNPLIQGDERSREFRIEGDELIILNGGPKGRAFEFRWRRVE